MDDSYQDHLAAEAARQHDEAMRLHQRHAMDGSHLHGHSSGMPFPPPAPRSDPGAPLAPSRIARWLGLAVFGVLAMAVLAIFATVAAGLLATP